MGTSELYEQIYEIIVQRKGIIRVKELEQLSGYSARYINKLFELHLGLSAKQVCKAVKFRFILEDMKKSCPEKFVDIASEYKFYDQSHFVHEFKEVTGKTPSEFFGKSLPLESDVSFPVFYDLTNQ